MNSRPTEDPTDLIQRQLDAYNAKDLERLLATYADDAEHYEHPATLLAKGKAQLAERFSARFLEPNLHAKLLHRTVLGSKVVDHERITRTFPQGPGELDLVVIYEVSEGRIARAWLLPGPPVLHSPTSVT